MDNMTSHLTETTAAQIPDLDWLSLQEGEKDNIPTPMNVRIIPQLEEQWLTKEDKGAVLAPNCSAETKPVVVVPTLADIAGVVRTAKIAAMSGIVGKELSKELSNKYPEDLLKASKEELVKVAEEQGLLGNVYVDLTAFSSCKEAATKLGSNKVRSAQFVVGECKHVCASHKSGYCSELKKTVVEKVAYDASLLSSYEKHLKVVGKLAADGKIDTKDALQEVLLKSNAPKASNKAGDTEFTDSHTTVLDSRKKKEALKKEVTKKEASDRGVQASLRFEESKPILAFIQDNMLKGKIGDSLKEAISQKYSNEVIAKFAHEINEIVSRQGLLGNVYADISFYKSSSEAIKSIKQASTNPQYLVQTVVSSEFDNSLEVVAKATGCTVLPRDGKIDTKIASSYIDDIMFSDRIALDKGAEFKNAIEAGENALGIIRQAYMATLSYKKQARVAGVQATYAATSGSRKASVDTTHLRTASYNALSQGLSVESIESKLASILPAVEAAGLMAEVVSGVREVQASSLEKCSVNKYAFSNGTVIVPTEKCGGCILNNKTACLKQKLSFKDTDKGLENPVGEADSKREDISQEYEISDDSGMNIALSKLASHIDSEINTDYNASGIDAIMEDL